MISKYKINNNELILDIKFLYNVGFDENKESDIYKYVNQVITTKKIKFQGQKILVYINGILLGIIYLTNYYLQKLNNYKPNYQITSLNSYLEKKSILYLN